MTTTAKKKRWVRLCSCENGPGSDDLKKASDWIIAWAGEMKSGLDKARPIFSFGTTKKFYRSFPIHIKGIKVDNGRLTIEGILNYSDYTKTSQVFTGRRIRIREYNPHTRHSPHGLECWE